MFVFAVILEEIVTECFDEDRRLKCTFYVNLFGCFTVRHIF